MGTSGDYAPFSTRTADGDYTGFDVEVARAYAAERGRPLVFVPFRWPELVSRLAAGDFDVAMSGVTVRPDRLAAGDMTATVARSEAVLAVAATSTRTARTIAVNRGGHLEHVARARFPRARLIPVDDNTTLPALLAGGAADAIVTDTLELAAFEAACAGTHPCFRVARRLARDRKAYWVAPTAGALAADLDAWLVGRERSGWLPALRARVLRDEAPASWAPEEASLLERVRRRLSLMPAVAAVKRAAGKAIEDRAREAAIARAASARAAAVGLDPATFVAFVDAQIAAAKTIQRATPRAAGTATTLAELRGAIDRLDGRIVLELATIAPIPATAEAVAAALADDDIPGWSPRLALRLARALIAVRPAPPMSSTAGLRLCYGSVGGGG